MTASSIQPPPSDLVTIEVAGAAPHVRLTAAGEVDSSSAPVLRQHLDAALDSDVSQLTVDLCQVSFLDSAGLCVLAGAYRRAVAQGVRMRVLASSRAVIRPLQITGLFELLQVERAGGTADSVVA